jgi:hypothetical protein
MKTYLIQFKWSDPYPKDASYRKTATSMATAANRGIKEWKKEHGRGVKTLSINISTL